MARVYGTVCVIKILSGYTLFITESRKVLRHIVGACNSFVVVSGVNN